MKHTNKRTFHGNQHSPGHSKAKQVCLVTVPQDSLDVNESDTGDTQITENPSTSSKDTPTTSENKLLCLYKVIEEAEDSWKKEIKPVNGDDDGDDDGEGLPYNTGGH